MPPSDGILGVYCHFLPRINPILGGEKVYLPELARWATSVPLWGVSTGFERVIRGIDWNKMGIAVNKGVRKGGVDFFVGVVGMSGVL